MMVLLTFVLQWHTFILSFESSLNRVHPPMQHRLTPWIAPRPGSSVRCCAHHHRGGHDLECAIGGTIAFFWGIFTIFYTTVFARPASSQVLLVHGYWLVQQGVEQGSQPEYYIWSRSLCTVPSAIGAIVTIALG
jgi:hypothetical protein